MFFSFFYKPNNENDEIYVPLGTKTLLFDGFLFEDFILKIHACGFHFYLGENFLWHIKSGEIASF